MNIGDKVNHNNPAYIGTVLKIEDGFALVDFGMLQHPNDISGTSNSDRPIPFWEYPKPYRVWIKVDSID